MKMVERKTLSLLALLLVLACCTDASVNRHNAWSIGMRSGMAKWTGTMNPRSNQLLAKSKPFSKQEDVLPKSDEQSLVSHDLMEESKSANPLSKSPLARGGAAAVAAARRLCFWENMVCGAVSRSCAQTIMHPANTMKTLLQSDRGGGSTIFTLIQPSNWKVLSRGAGAQLIMSMPHGAVNFAVLEYVRRQMNYLITTYAPSPEKLEQRFGAGLDFASSAISTIACSIVSTPQMMITDNIMAGTYPNLVSAVKGLSKSSPNRISGFYTGWWPGLAGKIPSYALTWTFFQQLKEAQLKFFKRPPKDIENSIMGCLASGTTVCIMIPMDTIKTRLVTQANFPDLVPYKGILDCAKRVLAEEGVGAFYRGLTPRLVSVVPMIGIQFGIYEYMKKFMTDRTSDQNVPAKSHRTMSKTSTKLQQRQERKQFLMLKKEKEDEVRRDLEAIASEVAADDDQPFPAPQRHNFGLKLKGKK